MSHEAGTESPEPGTPGGDSGRRQKSGLSLFGHGPLRQGSDAAADAQRRALTALPPSPLFAPARVWKSLTPLMLDDDRLRGNGLFPASRGEPAAVAFDLLRTRLLQAVQTHGHRRIAITSPTHGCGKTFVAANLALSLARRPEGRAVLIDMDLRAPALAEVLGVSDAANLGEFLNGEQPLEAAFRRHGTSLALGLNGAAMGDAGERLQDPGVLQSLEAVAEQLDPDVLLYDMPPALVCDDLLAMAPAVDAVLLVADGTRTSPADIRRTEELLGAALPILGVVLNRSQEGGIQRRHYGKA